MNDTILVTGGAGFIGSAVVRHLLERTDKRVVNVDLLTYAGNLANLPGVEPGPRYRFERADVADERAVRRLFAEERPGAVLHLAAETHVDRSIDGPAAFLRTNVQGTFALLEAARDHWNALDEAGRAAFRFLHVSTDEVFGSLGADGFFREDTPYAPRSPYSASKAASDHLALSYFHTYGLPVLISNCSNNYGPYQHPEKLIPMTILRALRGQEIPIYGRGDNVRDWLFVTDHVEALLAVLERGRPGESYLVGGHNERTNLEVARAICALLDERVPGRDHAELIAFVADRPGHDHRYAIDPTKIERELGWRPRETFDTGLARTVDWYLANRAWCDTVLAGRYDLERLGTL